MKVFMYNRCSRGNVLSLLVEEIMLSDNGTKHNERNSTGLNPAAPHNPP